VRRAPIITIDGPAGAGKSTVARLLADALGYVLVDTGAMYRAVAFAARAAGDDWMDADRMGHVARSLVARESLTFERAEGSSVVIRIDGRDVTESIRSPEIARGASAVSAHAAVRDALLDMQRRAGKAGGVVLEGRDLGTVVFPDAEVKFFLTARPEVRARRRFEELVAKGVAVSYEETLRDVLLRDDQDTHRAVAPLRRAPDAMIVDNSDIGIVETVARMTARVRTWSAKE
jgi:cytidylate kinase